MLAYKKLFDDVFEEIGKVIVGQQEMVTQILSAVLADGNALLEGYPGLAKTLTVRTLAKIMDLRFSRIQNTPDLMPSDITGTYVLEEANGKREFKFYPGPIFANLVLDQVAFVNGKFEKGDYLIGKAKAEGCEMLEYNGKRLYKLKNSHTLSM